MHSTIFSSTRYIYWCIHLCACECDLTSMAYKNLCHIHKMDTTFSNVAYHWRVHTLSPLMKSISMSLPLSVRVAIQRLQIPYEHYVNGSPCVCMLCYTMDTFWQPYWSNTVIYRHFSLHHNQFASSSSYQHLSN